MYRVEPNRNVYIGHRYVPLLVGEWDKSIQYEGLSIVTFKGASYTSKKMTPAGIDIGNDEYWVLTGNYNAQVEYYRLETERVSDDLAQAKIDLNKRMDDTVEHVDTNVENLTIYVNDEVRKNKEYVDSEVLELTGYVNDETASARQYVNDETASARQYVNDETASTRQYVNDETDLARQYVDDETDLARQYVDDEVDGKVNKTDTVVNVKDYEEFKNGDDWGTAFNEAIKNGGSIEIPPGEYIIRSTIITSPDTKIFGYGDKSLLLIYTDIGILLSGIGGRYSILSDFKVLGMVNDTTLIKYIDDPDGYAIRWTMKNVKVMMDSISYQNTIGIEIHGGWIGEIYSPIIRFCQIGLKIHRNEISGTSFNGLNIFGGEIQGNTTGVDSEFTLGMNFFGTAIEGNRNDGAILRGSSRMVAFKGCYFEANGIDDPENTNDIKITTENPLATFYGINVDNCTFLRANIGCETAISNIKGGLTIVNGTRFSTYKDDVPVIVNDEIVNNGAQLYIDESVRFDSNYPIENNARKSGFIEQYTIQNVMDMVSHDTTGYPHLNFYLRKSTSNAIEIELIYTAEEAGNVLFNIVYNDYDTIDDNSPRVVETVEGINKVILTLNTTSSLRKGADVEIRVSRLGGNASDTNNGLITMRKLSVTSYNAQLRG